MCLRYFKTTAMGFIAAISQVDSKFDGLERRLFADMCLSDLLIICLEERRSFPDLIKYYFLNRSFVNLETFYS